MLPAGRRRLPDGAERLRFALLTKGDALPVFAFKLKDDVENCTVFDVSAALRERGWQVPAYTFPKNTEDLAVLRVVVRRGFTMDVADMLLEDLRKKVKILEKLKAPVYDRDPGGFHHSDRRGRSGRWTSRRSWTASRGSSRSWA